MIKIKTTYLLLILLFGFCSTSLYAAPPTEPKLDEATQRLGNISALKSEVLQLNSDLSILEQEILYPLLSQFSIYLTITDKHPFISGELTIKVDGQLITQQRYAPKRINALFNGGIQHLYVGKLKEGDHKLQVTYSWQDVKKKRHKGEFIHSFRKEFQAKRLELTMVDKSSSAPSLIKVIEWE